jgi:hypothetical protein
MSLTWTTTEEILQLAARDQHILDPETEVLKLWLEVLAQQGRIAARGIPCDDSGAPVGNEPQPIPPHSWEAEHRFPFKARKPHAGDTFWTRASGREGRAYHAVQFLIDMRIVQGRFSLNVEAQPAEAAAPTRTADELHADYLKTVAPDIGSQDGFYKYATTSPNNSQLGRKALRTLHREKAGKGKSGRRPKSR